MIGYDMIIQKENKDIVHHMDISECDSSLFDENDPYEGVECGPVKLPNSPRNKCFNLIVAWVCFFHLINLNFSDFFKLI